MSQPCNRPYRRPRHPCRGLLRALHGRVVSWLTVSQVVSRHNPTASLLLTCHNTVNCIVTLLPQAARLSRYNDCIVTQSPPAANPLLSRYNLLYRDPFQAYQAASSHDTIHCIATQSLSHSSLLLSQYNTVYCDTISCHSSLPSHNTKFVS